MHRHLFVAFIDWRFGNETCDHPIFRSRVLLLERWLLQILYFFVSRLLKYFWWLLSLEFLGLLHVEVHHIRETEFRLLLRDFWSAWPWNAWKQCVDLIRV